MFRSPKFGELLFKRYVRQLPKSNGSKFTTLKSSHKPSNCQYISRLLFIGGTSISTIYVGTITYNYYKEKWIKFSKFPSFSNPFIPSQNYRSFEQTNNNFSFACNSLIVINAVIFVMWRVKNLEPFMMRYFTLRNMKLQRNMSNFQYFLSMIGSTFSHHNFMHLSFNMLALYSLQPTFHQIFNNSTEQFIGTYLSAGIFSSMISGIFKIIRNSSIPSIGASGAIMAVIGLFCSNYPEALMQIIFLPFFSFKASTAMYSLISIDVLGAMSNWNKLDHFGHLGGILYGIVYSSYGNLLIWKNGLRQWLHSKLDEINK
ncbi:hypothetical protein SNEBB_010654 [Seison nebaliae]|nr:hypothetical protein SNEBB_010654 [Seison nebaliae]